MFYQLSVKLLSAIQHSTHLATHHDKSQRTGPIVCKLNGYLYNIYGTVISASCGATCGFNKQQYTVLRL